MACCGNYHQICSLNDVYTCGPTIGGKDSFECQQPGMGCVQVSHPPNKEKHRFSDLNECNQGCMLGQGSYDCMALPTSAGGNEQTCMQRTDLSGKYKTLEACNAICGVSGQNMSVYGIY